MDPLAEQKTQRRTQADDESGRPDPLAALTPAEIEQTVALVAASPGLPEALRWVSVCVLEPTRDEMDRLRRGEVLARRTRATCFAPQGLTLLEFHVDLDRGAVTDRREVSGAQPGVIPDERDRIDRALADDVRWLEALRRRGIEPRQIETEIGPAGALPSSEDSGPRRLGRVIAFLRRPREINFYAHPLQGLVALVDLAAGEVLEVLDDGDYPIPAESGEFFDRPGARAGLRAIEISQPEGPSYVVSGNEVRWDRWRFRFTLDHVEGLVLQMVSYEDQGRERPILHRAALSEMVVPYGDPAPTQYWRNAFDASEAGVGAKANSLELGCDCLGEIRYFDAAFVEPDGSVRTVPRAICLHEEDFGIAWKHHDRRSGRTAVRRKRRLVISSIATMGNYDYGFYWYFYPDGSLEHEVKLTGIVYTGAVDASNPTPYGAVIAPDLYAPIHQHIFCYRLDFTVDGRRNRVEEINTRPESRGPSNPHGIAFKAEVTRFHKEADAARLASSREARTWRIANPANLNRLGQPTSYRLIPGATATLLADEEAHVSKLAGFARRNLWVTAYEPEERYAAGGFPAFAQRGEGVAEWSKKNRPIDDTDVVVWHVVASTHVPRPEDWPVMPVDYVGFKLKPDGFFAENPALDLPEGNHGHHGHEPTRTA